MAITKPTRMLQPFANSGEKNTIPNNPDTVPGHASMDLGFPPLTMTRIEAGGVPPSGLDFNGILNWITQHTTWQNAGCLYTFDATLAAAIGGYPVGAVLESDDGRSSYINVVDANVTNFNTTPTAIGVSWMPYGGDAVSAAGQVGVATTGGTTTLTAAQATRNIIIVTGALTSDANIVFPNNVVRSWVVLNKTTGNFAVRCTPSGGTSVAVSQGARDIVVSDGASMSYGQADAVDQVITDSSSKIANTRFVQGVVAQASINSVVQFKNAAFSAGTTGEYWVDTRAGAFAMTMPDPPVAQNISKIKDIGGMMNVYPLTINFGSKTLLGGDNALVVDVSGVNLDIYYDGTNWRIV